MRYTPKHAAPKQSTSARRTATAVAVGASTLGAGLIVNTTSAHAAPVSAVAATVAPASVSVKSASSGVKLAVDGVIGPKTTKALQRWVGAGQTGSLNLSTRKALQRKVGTSQDGVIGPKTVAALQKKIGVSRDGARYLNARTVKGLQSYLNRTLKLTGSAPVSSSAPSGGSSRGGERLNLARAAMWDRIAWCESGRRWGLVASNGTGTYYGGLMMTHDAWRIGGGLAFSYNANQSSREEQITVANSLYAQLGLKPWSCRHAA